MNSRQYLAAEMYGYSYDYYQDKVDIRHERFTKYMSEDVENLKNHIDQEAFNEESIEALVE